MILTQIPPFFQFFLLCVNRRDGDAPDTQIPFDQLCARCVVVYVYNVYKGSSLTAATEAA